MSRRGRRGGGGGVDVVGLRARVLELEGERERLLRERQTYLEALGAVVPLLSGIAADLGVALRVTSYPLLGGWVGAAVQRSSSERSVVGSGGVVPGSDTVGVVEERVGASGSVAEAVEVVGEVEQYDPGDPDEDGEEEEEEEDYADEEDEDLDALLPAGVTREGLLGGRGPVKGPRVRG